MMNFFIIISDCCLNSNLSSILLTVQPMRIILISFIYILHYFIFTSYIMFNYVRLNYVILNYF